MVPASNVHVCCFLVFCMFFVISGRNYICISEACISTAHDKHSRIVYGCLPQDMHPIPTSLTSSSSARHQVTSTSNLVNHHAQVPKLACQKPKALAESTRIEIDFDNSSDEDIDISLYEGEQEDDNNADMDDPDPFPFHVEAVGCGTETIIPSSNSSKAELCSSTTNANASQKVDVAIQTNYSMVFKVRACERRSH
jgi:hypothetical protein